MKLIIHDLSNEDFSSISKNIRGDNIVISKCKGINRCIGCFGCWIKTPGECVIKDDYNKISYDFWKAKNNALPNMYQLFDCIHRYYL